MIIIIIAVMIGITIIVIPINIIFISNFKIKSRNTQIRRFFNRLNSTNTFFFSRPQALFLPLGDWKLRNCPEGIFSSAGCSC